MPPAIEKNTLFYGDNLDILREHFPDGCIDLIYLDPPFNSNRSYNVLFADESGRQSEAQLTAFDDTWHWGPTAEKEYYDLTVSAPLDISKMIGAMRDLIGSNQMMAYLVMMTTRLVELHRVLKSTGSLYLHCDPTASHYLKIVLDSIFHPNNYINEIIWERFNFHADAKRWGKLHDVILLYAKNAERITFNTQRRDYEESYIKSHFKADEHGRIYRLDNAVAAGQGPPRVFFGKLLEPPPGTHWRYSQENIDKLSSEGRIVLTSSARPSIKRYLDEMPGHAIGDIWTDIPEINSQAAERLGYPTQKPLALLERIIQASSNPGDQVLDPFCGCGTAIAAAEKLGRRWIGIDITHLAITLIKYRIRDMFPESEFEVIGEPKDLEGARRLAKEDRFQFQWWALSLIQDAKAVGGSSESKKGKKGKDQGIDGILNIIDDPKGKAKSVIIQVKSGKVSSRDIRDLNGALTRENAPIALFLTLEIPTRDMITEAASAGFYHSAIWDRDYPRIQILTIEDLLKGTKPEIPPSRKLFEDLHREKKSEGTQAKLEL